MSGECGSGGAMLSNRARKLIPVCDATTLATVSSDPVIKFQTLKAIGEAPGDSFERKHPSPRCKNLAEPFIANGGWRLRDQYARNTCSAFCVAATAELSDFYKNGLTEIPAYSDEALYTLLSDVPYEDVVMDITPREIERFNASGSRFLAQAKVALENGALLPLEALPYDPDLEADQTHYVSKDLRALAKSSALSGVTNEIVLKDEDGDLLIGPGRPWAQKPGSTGEGAGPKRTIDVVKVFLKQLRVNKAIAAGFPLMSGADYAIWFGEEALRTGRVKYPGAGHFEAMDIDGGHSVCIVGYDTNGYEPGEGVFIFRNSFNRDFAWDANGEKHLPTPAKGYGTISFHDVRWFCMEFLHY